MQYRISIKETNIGFVYVEAESLEQAQGLALREYENGDIEWTGSEAEVLED